MGFDKGDERIFGFAAVVHERLLGCFPDPRMNP
jgi:hypothetical protein